MKAKRGLNLTGLLLLTLVVGSGSGQSAFANVPPVAKAGLPRYAAQDPVRLDGSESYDPDQSGPLSYAWTQVSGPPLALKGADTATPTISGFVQTAQIQECKFGLVVSDGDMKSASAFTSILVVPAFRLGSNELELYNSAFDPNKPTLVEWHEDKP